MKNILKNLTKQQYIIYVNMYQENLEQEMDQNFLMIQSIKTVENLFQK